MTKQGYLKMDGGGVLGVSKLVRIVELLAHRPVLQEQLTQDIVNAFKKISHRGLAVVVKGEHFCMKMRGVKTPQASIVTSAMEGVFREMPSAREEFFELVRIGERKFH